MPARGRWRGLGEGKDVRTGISNPHAKWVKMTARQEGECARGKIQDTDVMSVSMSVSSMQIRKTESVFVKLNQCGGEFKQIKEQRGIMQEREVELELDHIHARGETPLRVTESRKPQPR